MTMNAPFHFTGVLAALSIALVLAACNDANDSRTPGQKLDGAIAKTEKAMEGLKGEARTAGQEAKQAASNLSEKIDVSATEAGITARVKTALAKDPELNALKIDVDTSGGRVLLKGTAPTLAAKERATTIAKSVDGVLGVDNQLVVPVVAPKG